tara:strand:- start:135 stop:512 length:378 start_codon:yes stop_codon:yes gene_type:complete
MNKHDIMRKVNAAPFGKDIILMHGAAMVMLGVRETTNDIDCQIDLEKYPALMLTGKECSDGVTRYEWDAFDFGDGKLREVEYFTVDGIKCQSLGSIVEDKQKLGRPKDIAAIKEINEFLKRDNHV